MKTALIIFGGKSSEYEVSLRSAASVIENIPKDKYSCLYLGITKDGKWLYYEGSPSLLLEDLWQSKGKCTPAAISPNADERALLIFRDSHIEKVNIDVVFPVLHGKNGEDGTIQGLLELSDIPCVGCGVLSSAICMDKAFSNTIADYCEIPQAKWLAFNECEYNENPDLMIQKAIDALGLPLFVKPANAGSSVGVSKAKSQESLKQAIKEGFMHDNKLVLEEAINARELECSVLGNEYPTASLVGEVLPCNEFYDYNAKYIDENSLLVIPAELPVGIEKKVQELAVKIYKALDCKGLARVDFFLRKSDDAVLFNELNTMPGFTSISMYPKLFEASGIAYDELLDRLLELAMKE